MKVLSIFTKRDIFVWAISVIVVTGSFFIGGSADILSLVTSLLGVTALIFIAKGHYIGNAIVIVFSIFYGVISYSNEYYGEMITYVGMTLPMAVLALIAWLRNPFEGEKTQVEIATIDGRGVLKLLGLTLIVTVVFYFILKALGTASLFFSTLSVATSFFAASLTFKRSELYALGYALNDLVLIVLWTIASFADLSNLTMVACFAMFFANDMYGYFCWIKMKKIQGNVS